MTEQKRDALTSASHISMLHRPYGPRVHRDENASGGAPAGGAAAPATSAPESFSSSEDAARFWLSSREPREKENSGTANADAADDALEATAENELSVEDNAAPDESQAHGEDQGANPAAEPPIARPKSWTEAEDAEWRSTPRALQEKIVARELERDTAIRRAQNDAAEKLKGLTAKEQAAEQARQQYEAKLPELMKAIHKTNNTAFSDIQSADDAELLAVVDPPRWVQWQAHQQRMQQTDHELQQAEARKDAKHQSEWKDFRNKEDALATEKIPDLADPVKADKLMKRAGAKLAELGFTPGELNDYVTGKEKIAVIDHRFQQLVFAALKLDDIQAASKKVAAAPKPLPPVQRPGNTAPNRAAQDTTALSSKLTSSGSLNDAAALLIARRSASRA